MHPRDLGAFFMILSIVVGVMIAIDSLL